MRQSKQFLDDRGSIEEGFIIGIITADKSYTVAWHINRAIGCDLERTDDWFAQPGNNIGQGFDLYHYNDDWRKTNLFLLKNKQGGQVASKKFDIYDYLLFIFGEIDIEQRDHWYSQLSSNNAFSLVKLLDLNPSDIKF